MARSGFPRKRGETGGRPGWLGRETGHNEGRPGWLGRETGHNEGRSRWLGRQSAHNGPKAGRNWSRRGFLLAGLAATASGGCVIPAIRELTLPSRHNLVREQLVFHSDFPLPQNHRLLEELTARRFDLAELLALPRVDEPVHIYLFQDGEQFKTFLKLYHPDFPQRRAFFLETDTRLEVYAQWGDSIAEDLRHEVCHGYLHAVVPGVSLWFDEGLAEYSEAPRGHHGIHRAHLANLKRRIEKENWQPNLPRLDHFAPTRDMTQDEYAEAWAWVHFLVETRPELLMLVRTYLADLRRQGSTEGLSPRLHRMLERPDLELTAHVRRLVRENAWQQIAEPDESPH